MKFKTTIAATLLALGAAGSAFADAIPYAPVGTANTAAYDFTATATGDLVVYFYSQDAGASETIGVRVNGVDSATTVLNNHSSSQGDFKSLGSVSKGDSLVFFIDVGGTKYYSDAGLNSDGVQHAYSTSFSGLSSPFIPSGTFVSFEDEDGGGDKDYNDTAFVFTNVTAAVPEPANVALLLAGMGLLGAASRRRKN